jgi:hypothetical protein
MIPLSRKCFIKLSVFRHLLHDIKPSDKFAFNDQLGESWPIIENFEACKESLVLVLICPAKTKVLTLSDLFIF